MQPRITSIAGILGPVVFVVVFLVMGQITPSYSATGDVISNLELGPNGWVQQLNFFQMGTLIIVFALGFREAMKGAIRGVRTSTMLLVVSGLGMIDAAFFTPAFPVPHALGFLFFMFPLLIAIFLTGVWFLRAGKFRRLGVFSLADGVVTLVLLLYFFYLGASAPMGAVPGGLVGVVNRAFVIVALAWLPVVGFAFARSSRPRVTT